jgi:Signal transduction histidine kinase
MHALQFFFASALCLSGNSLLPRISVPCSSYQENQSVRKRSGLRSFFIKNQKGISRAELKRLMLSGFLALMSLIVAFIYSVFDLINGVFYSQPAYIILAAASMLAITLMRSGRFTLARVILLAIANLVVFWAAITDPFETGVFLFFIPAGIGSFAMLGNEERKASIALASFTTLLFLLAYFVHAIRIPVPPPEPIYIKISLLINYIISLTIAILAINFLISLNRESENELIHKEELAKQRNEELRKVNVELDRFVYSVSHDLRSPLSSIQGLINIAKLSQDPEEIRNILLMIEDRVNSQEHFIKEIIDYSRNTRTETRRDPIHLRELVSEIVNSLRFSLDASKIDFRISIPADTILLSDRIRLTVILSNLIGNAIKYHDLSKPAPFIEIGYQPDESILYITDNGSGIDPTHAGRIFDMFYRASESSKGSGLGLFITKETITRLGGTISVESALGKGSTFQIHLPGRV